MKKLIILVLIILLASCAPEHIECPTNVKLLGFWWGLWHGWISPITFVISLFNDSVEMYARNNNGGWYDFGFILGVGGLSFGSSKAS